jgi:hypothetical protein
VYHYSILVLRIENLHAQDAVVATWAHSSAGSGVVNENELAPLYPFLRPSGQRCCVSFLLSQ